VGTQTKEEVTLLTDYAVDSAYSQAYYTLFANIRFNWDNEQTQHTVLLTAADRSEQATIVANVAIAAAFSGTPTILIDTDLRNSNLHQRFGAKNAPGLSNWLTLATHEETVTQFLSKTFVPDLHLLSVGTSMLQPHEVSRLLSTKLQHIIASTRQFLAETEQASMIIFNSPPVLAGMDASLVGSLVEQTFLLITAGQTTQTQAKQAQEQLRRAHAKVTGAIMLNA
jgi:capsular exopolysaccharide synthesis family protein